MASDKIKELLTKLRKDYGKEIAYLIEDDVVEKIEVIPSSIPGVNDILGCGGLPKGRIVELYGLEASAKSSLCFDFVASEQKRGGTVFYIDAENALLPERAALLGVDLNNLIISQQDTVEQAFNAAALAIESGATLVIIDSLASLTTDAEVEGEIGDMTVGLQARLIGSALRKLKGIVNRNNVTLILVNQMREKIGGMMFSEKYSTPGGLAVKFYASVRIDMRNIGKIKGPNETIIGNEIKIKITKNKVAAPFKECVVKMMFDKGWDTIGSLFDVCLKKKTIIQKGATFFYVDENGVEQKLGVDRNPSVQALAENKQLQELLMKR